MPARGKDQTATIGSPLVTKPVVKRKRYQPASVIPGIPHFIEGMPQFSSIKRPHRSVENTFTGFTTKQSQESGGRDRATYREDTAVSTAMKKFNLRQQARSRITPIADPEAGKQERRRSAARKRMRGRLGTLLSNRETLA